MPTIPTRPVTQVSSGAENDAGCMKLCGWFGWASLRSPHPTRCLTDADRTRLAARSLAKYFPSRSYGVVARKGKYLSQQARDFIELIRPQMLAMREYDETGHSGR